MGKIIKLAYTYEHPKWQAPSGKQYQVKCYELKRKFVLFADDVEIVRHTESDFLLLYLLKHEMGWHGNTKNPLSPKEKENLRLLEQALCLTYHGIFIHE